MTKTTTLLSALAVLAMTGAANANIVINEVLGSTSSSDLEFIELYNTTGSSVDISGWYIELWDSDTGAAFGTADAGSPYVIPASTSISAGGFYLLANGLAETGFSVTADFSLPSNAIENSSYTIILKDAGASVIDSIFVNDGDTGDAANDAGSPLAAGATVGPDGTFLPAGAYRTTDGGSTFGILEFGNDNRGTFTPESGTPGATNVPEPATLALLGLGGLALVRRRR